jgi:hypothetical protein
MKGKDNPKTERYVITRIVCLRAPTDANLRWAIVLSDPAVKLAGDPNGQWYNFARNLAAYRAGNFPKRSHHRNRSYPAFRR